jgi:neutral ceramidase
MMANPTDHSIHSKTLPDFTNRSFNFAPPYRSDQPHPFRSFGDVLIDVPFLRYNRHLKPIISALFVAANPRNDPMLGKTFLTVEKKVNGNWEIVRTDNDYDTRYIYTFGLVFFLI